MNKTLGSIALALAIALVFFYVGWRMHSVYSHYDLPGLHIYPDGTIIWNRVPASEEQD